jgi:hypothetical protein
MFATAMPWGCGWDFCCAKQKMTERRRRHVAMEKNRDDLDVIRT